MSFLPGTDPRALAWLEARGRAGSLAVPPPVCPHPPYAHVTEPGRTHHERLPSGVVREITEEGPTWCPLCSPDQAEVGRAVLRWVRHGLCSSWNVATELAVPLRVAGRALGWLAQHRQIERVDQIRIVVDGRECVVGLWVALDPHLLEHSEP